jgi:hypothetical protein
MLIVLSGLSSLTIMANDGAPANQYRIHRKAVEFRSIPPHGQPGTGNRKWRALDNDEIQLHFALQTPVADWLDKNLYPSNQA